MGKPEKSNDGAVKRSIAIRLIRHAESMNNQIYYDARRIYNGGKPEFDPVGWNTYVDERRKADPGLSDRGKIQATKLSQYLAPHLFNQASHPVKFIVSPMKRTLETILPLLLELEHKKQSMSSQLSSPCSFDKTEICDILVNGFYFESEGCHLRGKPEQGMNPREISELFCSSDLASTPIFVGFDEGDPNKGWYAHGTGAEEREESEARAAKFYLWLCEFLDAQLADTAQHDIFDAGVAHPEDDHVHDHDKFSPRKRKRRTAILVGHGDFMGLLLKRIMAGFGHAVENEGIPHRSAFVHFNTGITELEYFGNGRFLLMGSNHIPHLDHPDDISLKTGGSLKDGWSFLIPDERHFLDEEVSVAFSDELDNHVREQTEAMKNLYLRSYNSSKAETTAKGANGTRRSSAIRSMCLSRRSSSAEAVTKRVSTSKLTFEQLTMDDAFDDEEEGEEITFVVKRGLQVVGCASFRADTMTLIDIVVRQSCRRSGVGTALIDAVKKHLKQTGNHDRNLFVTFISDDSKTFFEKVGFELINEASEGSVLTKMKCRL